MFKAKIEWTRKIEVVCFFNKIIGLGTFRLEWLVTLLMTIVCYAG